MGKENKILWKCRTEVDEDLIEEYILNPDIEFDSAVNSSFIYIYELNPAIEDLLIRAYGKDKIRRGIDVIGEEHEPVYFYDDELTGGYCVRYEKGGIEGTSAKHRDKNQKEAIEAYEYFIEILNGE